MTLFEIVALYVSLNLLILTVLTLRVGQVRISKQISLGDGGHPTMLSRVRAHANFIETAPMALIALLLLAALSAPPLVLHIVGGSFTVGRVFHAHGMAQKNALGLGRSMGAGLTLLVYIGTALYLFYLIFFTV